MPRRLNSLYYIDIIYIIIEFGIETDRGKTVAVCNEFVDDIIYDNKNRIL